MNKNFLNFYYRLEDKSGKNNLIITLGVIKRNEDAYAYIQVFFSKTKKIVYLKYDIKDFLMCLNPQYVQIRDNLFMLDLIQMNIQNVNLNIFGKIKALQANSSKYNVMGPFSKQKNIPCKTGIFNMYSKVDGYMYIDGEKVDFTDGTIYVQGEKGEYYPEKYIWYNSSKLISNSVTSDTNAITMCISKYCGNRIFYISLLLEGVSYVFSTYNGGRIKYITLKRRGNKEVLDIRIKQKNIIFNIRVIKPKGHFLSYPFEDSMKKVTESLDSEMIISMYKHGDKRKIKKIFKSKFINGVCQIKL